MEHVNSPRATDPDNPTETMGIRFTKRYRSADEAFYAERLRAMALPSGGALVCITPALVAELRTLLANRLKRPGIAGASVSNAWKANGNVDRKGLL